MRKIALIAMLAIVGAMVPLTTASTAAPGTGTVYMINGTDADYDLWIEEDDNVFLKFEIDDGNNDEHIFPAGNKRWVICENDSDSITFPTCVGSTTRGSGAFALNNGAHVTAVITFNGGNPTAPILLVGENDTHPTSPDEARITLHNFNAVGQPVSVCVDGKVVLQDVADRTTADDEADAAEPTADVGVLIGGGTDCSTPDLPLPLPFPEGTNVVLSIPSLSATDALADCYGNRSCIQIFVTGTTAESSDQLVPEFCAAIPGAQEIGTLLDSLFLKVVVGDPDTYPDPDEVEDVWKQIDKILDAGDEVVPADIADAWYETTDELRQLLTGLELVNFDLNDLPQSDLQSIVDGIQEPSGPTPEDEARTVLLTDWFTTNCIGAVEAEPTFTG